MKCIYRICGWMILLMVLFAGYLFSAKNIISSIMGILFLASGIYLARYKMNWWKSILTIILPTIILIGSFTVWTNHSDNNRGEAKEDRQRIKNSTVGCIIVDKSDKTMQLLTKENGVIIKTYNVELGFNPKGPKHFIGDGKTPEGTYRITGHHLTAEVYKGLSWDNQCGGVKLWLGNEDCDLAVHQYYNLAFGWEKIYCLGCKLQY